ncbi:MAG: alpha-ketoacid dehydrogenase subunit beta, partial [Patescibacteria group bacterium]
MYDGMTLDATIHLFGEGAHVKIHYDAPRIEADFLDRVHTLPISEDGSTNFAVGASLLGIKPVVDVISADFLYRTMDSICNTAAKLNFMRPT